MRRISSWMLVALISLVVFGGSLLFGEGGANAATCVPYPAGCTSAATSVPVKAPTAFAPVAAPAAAPAAVSTSGTLAFTGADIAGTVVLGVALIGVGAVVVGATRRRRST